MMCQSTGRPPISTMGLGLMTVSSRSRVPLPPHMMITFIQPPPVRHGAGQQLPKVSYPDRPGWHGQPAAMLAKGVTEKKPLFPGHCGGANAWQPPASALSCMSPKSHFLHGGSYAQKLQIPVAGVARPDLRPAGVLPFVRPGKTARRHGRRHGKERQRGLPGPDGHAPVRRQRGAEHDQ